jgi:hypothetical protein
MNIIDKNDNIVVINEKNIELLKIPNNYHTNFFIKNWYFLTKYVDNEHYKDSFSINYR